MAAIFRLIAFILVGWLTFVTMVISRKSTTLSLTPFLTAQGEVSHIAADLHHSGSILFSEESALLTATQGNATVIVGQRNQSSPPVYREGATQNATFGKISSFVQPNTTHVFIADAGYGCVRSVDRVTKSSRRIAGTCVKLGKNEAAVDGNMLSVSFSTLSGIDYFNQAIYVIEIFDYRIRKIDFSSGNVTTVVSITDFYSQLHLPWDIAVLPSNNAAYITLSYGIAKLYITNNTFEYLTKTPHTVGTKDGALSVSNWYYDTRLASLDPYLFVIDVYNYRIRVINTVTSQVSTLPCFSSKGKPFPAMYMTAIGLSQCKLYVSSKRSRTISYVELPESLCARKTLEKKYLFSNAARDAGIIGGVIAGGMLLGMVTIALTAYIHKRWQQRRVHALYRAQYSSFASAEPKVTLVHSVDPTKKLT